MSSRNRPHFHMQMNPFNKSKAPTFKNPEDWATRGPVDSKSLEPRATLIPRYTKLGA
jgi:hypothetical protein